MEQATILIADDNPEIREIIQILLSGEGFQVHEAAGRTQALGMLKENTFDLIILDIMMPGLNGYQTCLEIRKSTNVPILFLSARTQESDKTLGFSAGGDDYLAKPFSYAELVSRAKAMIRRYQVYQGKPAQPSQPDKITYHQLQLDELTQEVTKNGIPVELTDTEYSILLLLLMHPGQIFSTEHLYESIWNEPYYYGANNVIMVHIRNLRRKIEDDPKNPTLIKTVWEGDIAVTKKVKFKKKRSHSNHLTALRGKNPLWKIPRIRLQFLVTLLLSFILAVGGFSLTWHMMPCAWKIARHIPGMDLNREALKTELTERAKNYDLPSSENNKQEQAAFKPFFDCLDSYTGIAIYSGSKHYFRTQHTADIVHSKNWNFFTNMIFQITYSNYASVLPLNGIEDYFQIEVEFKNETGELYVSSFHNSKLTIPWFLFSIGVALFLLLLLPLLFLRKKVQDIGILKDHILQMSGGDLNQPIASMGNDELGVLARELDQMRSTLYTNIQQEVESRRANQDLITAMSHDLRTPLTILHGYLDILALGRNPEQQSEYVRRCLQKTEDIQQLTDRMFEYSLVYEPPQSPLLVPIPLKNVQHMLSEHLDFLRLAGFQTSETIAPLYRQIEGDETSLKRLFQNLFSNVLKYGDKSEPVTLQISQKNDIFQIILSNAVKKDLTGIESNRIGLKSAEKIAKMHHGTLTFTQKDKTLFLVEVTFPLP